MHIRSLSFLFLALTCSLVACGDDSSGDMALPDGGKPSADGSTEDTTPPTLLSIAPNQGATGVREDAVVTLVFSEPMDQASVEAALDTEDLGTVTTSWNAAGDTITITPDAPLAYAEGAGDDPAAVVPKSFEVVLGSAATDLAGNGLGSSETASFSTLKRMATTFELDHAMTRSLTPEEELIGDDDFMLTVGDLDDDNGVRSVITFDLSMLPQDAVEVIEATFSTGQLIGDVTGAPYGDGGDDDGLGEAVLIDHVTFDALDNGAFNSNQVAHAHLGEFCVKDQVQVQLDVTAAVEDDRKNRQQRDDASQYLLRFALDNDQDGAADYVWISRNLAELEVTYLAP